MNIYEYELWMKRLRLCDVQIQILKMIMKETLIAARNRVVINLVRMMVVMTILSTGIPKKDGKL